MEDERLSRSAKVHLSAEQERRNDFRFAIFHFSFVILQNSKILTTEVSHLSNVIHAAEMTNQKWEIEN
jgi:hypothetical protein